MSASWFTEKQIMDLSRSKGGGGNDDFIDLMNPPPEEDEDEETSSSASAIASAKNKQDTLPSYDFHPIRPNSATTMCGGDGAAACSRAWNSADSKANAPPIRSYGYLGSMEPDKVIMAKAENVNGAEIVSEVDQTMKWYTDTLLHAIDGLSTRLSQLESRTRQIEHSVDDLKGSIGNNYGSTEGKMRQLENILREVQSGVQDSKDKQEVMEAELQLAKLQIPKPEKTPETHNTSSSNVNLTTQQQPSSAPQQQQFPVPSPQSLPFPALPSPNAPPPLPTQQAIHSQSLPQLPNQYLPTPVPYLSQQDANFPPPGQLQEVAAHQQYQLPSTQQRQSLPAPPSHQHQPYQSGSPPTPHAQAPQPPQQHPPPVSNPLPQLQTPMGCHSDKTAFIQPGRSQGYPAPTLLQPPSQPTSGAPPPTSQQYYGGLPPSQVYDPLPSGRSSFGFSSPAYAPPPNAPASEQYPYSGSPSRYGGIPPMKSHSSPGGSNYPQIPTARILPQAIPTASSIGGSGGASSGGAGNRVPIDDVIDKVTSMGFPREHVRATVRKLTENGQSVDLNAVLDKLMNDGVVTPQGGWFGR